MTAANEALGLSDLLCFSVYSTAHAFNRVYRPLLAPLGLTYPQYLVMLLLWEKDGRSVGAIGTALGLDSGTLTPLLKRLEAAGLIARRRSRSDERSVEIHLTDKGDALRAAAAGIAAAIGCALGDAIDEAARLRQTLERVRVNLLASAGSAG